MSPIRRRARDGSCRFFKRFFCRRYWERKMTNDKSNLNRISEKELELYITLANLVVGFIDLKPKHPLYNSIRKDIKNTLNQLKSGDNK